jgi:hypothetical protein
MVEAGKQDDLCKALINFGVATGKSLDLIFSFIKDEFRKNSSKEPGSIMRGTSMASRLTKNYLRKPNFLHLSIFLTVRRIGWEKLLAGNVGSIGQSNYRFGQILRAQSRVKKQTNKLFLLNLFTHFECCFVFLSII